MLNSFEVVSNLVPESHVTSIRTDCGTHFWPAPPSWPSPLRLLFEFIETGRGERRRACYEQRGISRARAAMRAGAGQR